MDFTDEDALRAWEEGALAWADFVRSGADYYRTDVHGPALRRACSVRPGERVLDLGSGEGYFSRTLASDGAVVTGLELSPTLVAMARAEAERLGLAVDYRVGSAALLDRHFAAEAFDVVTACMSVQDMSDVAACLSGAAHILRPTGRLVFSVPHPASDTPVRRWQRDATGNKHVLEVDRYFETGAAVCHWNMPRLSYSWTTPYWRKTISQWSDLISGAGFLIRRIHEPRPGPAHIAARPDLDDCARMPYFLIFDLVRGE